jgi:hypothetical protein
MDPAGRKSGAGEGTSVCIFKQAVPAAVVGLAVGEKYLATQLSGALATPSPRASA